MGAEVSAEQIQLKTASRNGEVVRPTTTGASLSSDEEDTFSVRAPHLVRPRLDLNDIGNVCGADRRFMVTVDASKRLRTETEGLFRNMSWLDTREICHVQVENHGDGECHFSRSIARCLPEENLQNMWTSV